MNKKLMIPNFELLDKLDIPIRSNPPTKEESARMSAVIAAHKKKKADAEKRRARRIAAKLNVGTSK
jgi:hypothetical protein